MLNGIANVSFNKVSAYLDPNNQKIESLSYFSKNKNLLDEYGKRSLNK